MAARKPTLTIFAGPNGSGKSTLVDKLRDLCDCGVLVNADQIAVLFAKRNGEDLPSVETQWSAARVAEDMRWALLAQRISFITLLHRKASAKRSVAKRHLGNAVELARG